MFLAGFSGLYFTVYAVTDETYRQQFFTSRHPRARAGGRRARGLPQPAPLMIISAARAWAEEVQWDRVARVAVLRLLVEDPWRRHAEGGAAVAGRVAGRWTCGRPGSAARGCSGRPEARAAGQASRSCSTRAAIVSTAAWSSPETSTVSPLAGAEGHDQQRGAGVDRLVAGDGEGDLGVELAGRLGDDRGGAGVQADGRSRR